jgi:hypothetical protein
MTAKFTQALKKVGTPFRHRSDSHPQRRESRDEEREEDYVKENHGPVFEQSPESPMTAIRQRRKSITLVSNIILHRKSRASIDSTRPSPALPPELIEKIASCLGQHELIKFSRVSRDCYTAAERHLYRRPFTRRFDKLLRTLEKHPYKGDFILELALGFETDFYSVKYVLVDLI